jgi:hypothetical protein
MSACTRLKAPAEAVNVDISPDVSASTVIEPFGAMYT